jgi:hypothetical protein
MSEKTEEIAARMGARAGELYVLTGVSAPAPWDTSPDAPPVIRAAVRAYGIAYVAQLPKPGQACCSVTLDEALLLDESPEQFRCPRIDHPAR